MLDKLQHLINHLEIGFVGRATYTHVSITPLAEANPERDLDADKVVIEIREWQQPYYEWRIEASGVSFVFPYSLEDAAARATKVVDYIQAPGRIGPTWRFFNNANGEDANELRFYARELTITVVGGITGSDSAPSTSTYTWRSQLREEQPTRQDGPSTDEIDQIAAEIVDYIEIEMDGDGLVITDTIASTHGAAIADLVLTALGRRGYKLVRA